MPRLGEGDRVLVFFSGHGHTEEVGDEDFGYIVPHDGSERASKLISMEQLRLQSRRMNRARHQLFIMDACYGGRLVTRSPISTVSPTRPDYVAALVERDARLVISAGGKNQRVLDGGPKGFSFFTGFLLEALDEDLADGDGDGYITTSELSAYMIPKATNAHQTPALGALSGHGQGEFIFRSPRGATVAALPTPEPPDQPPPVLRGGGGSNAEFIFWDSIKNSTNPAEFAAYLQAYPEGHFAALARIRMAALAPPQTAGNTPPAGPGAAKGQPPAEAGSTASDPQTAFVAPPAMPAITARELRTLQRDLERALVTYRSDPARPASRASPQLTLDDVELSSDGTKSVSLQSRLGLESLDLGLLSADVVPLGEERYEVTASLRSAPGARGGSSAQGECQVAMDARDVPLIWDSAAGAFTSIEAKISNFTSDCGRERLGFDRLDILSRASAGRASEPDSLKVALWGLQVQDGSTRGEGFELGWLDFQADFPELNRVQRERALAALPPDYWPRQLGLAGVLFDLAASGMGGLDLRKVAAYVGNLDLAVDLGDLYFREGDVMWTLDTANLTLRGAETALSIKMTSDPDGPSLGFMTLPHAAALELTLPRGVRSPTIAFLASLFEISQPRDLDQFLRANGPLSIKASAKNAAGWISAEGTLAYSATFTQSLAELDITSSDLAAVLLDSLQMGQGQELRLPTFRKVVASIANAVQNSDGELKQAFRVVASTDGKFMTVNGHEMKTLIARYLAACEATRGLPGVEPWPDGC